MGTRVGWGFDAHRFGGDPPVVLAGVDVSSTRGVLATSDGDVAAHAVIDALLGAAALGDLGSHFPSSEEEWHGANSMDLLARAARMAADAGVRTESVDLTVIAQAERVAPHREAMRSNLASVLGLEIGAVSVKATTTDGMGFIGAGEGIAAVAVVVASIAS